MSLMQDARLHAKPPASAGQRQAAMAWAELDNPAAWAVAVILLIMPLIANGFFLIEIFGTTMILGIIALSLMFLAGYGGLPRWVPFLDRLAETRTVIVPSLPGFPGGDRGHTVLDSHLDWVLAVRDTIDKAGLAGGDLVGSSVGGSFVAEVAAIWPDKVERLALIAPFGLFDAKDPATDPLAQKQDDIAGLMTAQPDTYKGLKEMPAGANSIEWPIEQTRAAEAAQPRSDHRGSADYKRHVVATFVRRGLARDLEAAA